LFLSQEVDFFIFDGFIFIVDFKSFEQLLDFRKITKEIADQALNEIFEAIPVRNPEALREKLMMGVSSVKKIAKTRGRPHVDKISLETAQRVIEKYQLPLEISDGYLEVDENDKEQVKAFVLVVNDAYVTSLQTGFFYIAHVADLQETTESSSGGTQKT
jgi:hypothetical protein